MLILSLASVMASGIEAPERRNFEAKVIEITPSGTLTTEELIEEFPGVESFDGKSLAIEPMTRLTAAELSKTGISADDYVEANPALRVQDINRDAVGPILMKIADDCECWTMYNKSACAIQTFKICNRKIKVKTYSADYAPDAVYSETSDALGGKYATCFAHNGRDNDFCLIKYNPQGDMEWIKIYDSGSADIPFSTGVDKEGNIYVAGFAYKTDSTSDVRTIKYNPDGEILWNKIYDSGGNDTPNNISFDEQGRVVIDCYSDDKGFHVIKYDADGNLK